MSPKGSVSDLHRFHADADLDPDPRFEIFADPDPVLDALKKCCVLDVKKVIRIRIKMRIWVRTRIQRLQNADPIEI